MITKYKGALSLANITITEIYFLKMIFETGSV